MVTLPLVNPAVAATGLEKQPGYVRGEFLYTQASFPSAHASTLAETSAGLLAAWFGGSDEGNADVSIWLSERRAHVWSAPRMVADGVQPDGTRHPCWNPVLFQVANGPLMLFYKVGPSPSQWWGMLRISTNAGETWSAATRLPASQLGPVRNKPVLLSRNALLCGSSTEDNGWRVHLERTTDLGQSWERSDPLNDARECGLIQPTILTWPDGRVQILCRSRQRQVFESWMGEDWRRWSRPAPISLPNPNSGIDGLVLQDGRGLLVYNHTPQGRSPLNLAVSRDGSNWVSALVLEDQPGEYSYPAVIQTRSGQVHVTYTWRRERIKHVIVDPLKLPMP